MEKKRREIVINLKDLQENKEVQELVLGTEQELEALGYTEHSHRHMNHCSKSCSIHFKRTWI